MFSVELSGTGRLRLRFQGVIDRNSDLRPVFKGRVDQITRQMFKDIFRTEGRAGGFSWATLAVATIREKRRLGLRRGILRRTDKLLRSVTMVNQEFTILKIFKNSYQRGTSHPAAQFHQEGTKHMPSRPIVPVEVPAVYGDQIRDVIRDYIFRNES